ncbi:hypothetical protein SKAU_G00396520 [Synaphobranchus kaupii]|uniref:Uncharacterized protein n=1 Tax=Synaphobranchus kaupii TaxID=118154 RepID=A0A9Q1ECJ5_SYNKA|nr:hypothetical protein SKAU_G00396520 [Synaphobranchus kaupii]
MCVRACERADLKPFLPFTAQSVAAELRRHALQLIRHRLRTSGASPNLRHPPRFHDDAIELSRAIVPRPRTPNPPIRSPRTK